MVKDTPSQVGGTTPTESQPLSPLTTPPERPEANTVKRKRTASVADATRTKRRNQKATAKHAVQADDAIETRAEESEASDEDITEQPTEDEEPPPQKQKLRASFSPPKHMQGNPCVCLHGEWEEIEWNERYDLPDRAWIQPLDKFFPPPTAASWTT